MNREIKFRGLYNGNWVEGNLLVVTLEGGIIYEIERSDYSDFAKYEVDGESVGQFTGLKDKNGVEIYEGDVYHMGDKNIKYRVVWHDSGFIGNQIGNRSFAGLEHWKNKIEVIGNIYESLITEG